MKLTEKHAALLRKLRDAGDYELPAFQGPCAYHPDAGWCMDELRTVTH